MQNYMNIYTIIYTFVHICKSTCETVRNCAKLQFRKSFAVRNFAPEFCKYETAKLFSSFAHICSALLLIMTNFSQTESTGCYAHSANPEQPVHVQPTASTSTQHRAHKHLPPPSASPFLTRKAIGFPSFLGPNLVIKPLKIVVLV